MTIAHLKSDEKFFDVSVVNSKPLTTFIDYDVDLLSLFHFLKNKHDDAYFFESLVMPEHQDRYFSIGFSAALVFHATTNELRITGSDHALVDLNGERLVGKYIHCDNPYRLLQTNFSLTGKAERHLGGLIGYTSYEAVNYFGYGLNLTEHNDFGTFKYGLYLDGLIYDSLTGSLSYYTYQPEKSRLKEVIADIEASKNATPPTTLKAVTFKGHSETADEFIGAVKRTQKKIKDGYSFQSEVGFKSYYHIVGDKFAIYNKLRQINPSPYMFYVKFDDIELMGASPEILVSNHDGDLLTTPTAGTTQRGKSDLEDQILARTLLSDPKEVAEHNMLVDLHRNDLAVVSEPFSVKVKSLMYLIKFSHVQHIVSDITSRIKKGCDSFDVLAAILPGGVVTGAPKIETIKIIDDNEATPRGVYGGAVGRFSFNGDCDFCLPIRSIFCVGDECYAQTSAGVVYDSVPEKEHIEVTNKLAAMKQTLESLGAK